MTYSDASMPGQDVQAQVDALRCAAGVG